MLFSVTQIFRTHIACFLLVFCSGQVLATGVYLQPSSFVNAAFEGSPPAAQQLVIKGSLKTAVRRILGYDLPTSRLRYWQQVDKTVWIIEDSGKYQAMTVGFEISENKITNIKVLIFREAQGWQVRQSYFTQRFEGATLGPDKQLDRVIDGLAGATYSSSSMINLSRLALFLNEYVRE